MGLIPIQGYCVSNIYYNTSPTSINYGFRTERKRTFAERQISAVYSLVSIVLSTTELSDISLSVLWTVLNTLRRQCRLTRTLRYKTRNGSMSGRKSYERCYTHIAESIYKSEMINISRVLGGWRSHDLNEEWRKQSWIHKYYVLCNM